jgi:hypothetical protein
MIYPCYFRFLTAAAALALPSLGVAAPVISEIFYHSSAIPEDVSQEWLEIYNPDAVAVDVSGWKLDKGVAFTFPAATSIPGLGRVVVAANLTAFNAAHPGFAGTVFGNWVGGLSNSGEQLQLVDALGVSVNDVTYASEGDWGLRARGPVSFSHQGWIWESAADGGGKSLELRNAALGNGSGQNWAESTAVGGTPGAANSAASLDLAPLIKAAEHKPNIPRATDAIKISCALEDESATPTATLHWRLDGAGAFTTAAMTDSDGDGRVDATIAPQANLSVIEWYVSATDGTNARTWPAAAKTSSPGVTPLTFGQVTNALLQVDDSYSAARNFATAGNQPVYRLIMTNAERLELLTIGTTSGQEESDATMNGTFISFDGTGTKVRYRSGFRNRGQASALGPPNNYHVSFPSDDRWEGRSAFALNCQFPYSQALGEAMMRRAGIATQEAAIVQVRVNGADLSVSTGVMYGRYARVEGRGGDWAKRHYPADPDGNFYRLDDHAYPAGDSRSGEFGYEGESTASYADTYFKETNKEENDYSDIIAMAKIVSAPASGGTAAQPAISDAAYPAAVATVLDIDHFYRFLAADVLIGNQEGGLQSGRADDTSLYRGVVDTRFRIVPHDFDDVFDIGSGFGDPITRSMFSYNISSGGLTGLPRMFNHPQLLPRYYAALLDAMNTWFNHTTADPIIDQITAGWVPAADGNAATPNQGIAEIKGFIDARRNILLPLIPQTYSLNVTGTTADTAEGYKVTTTGVATFAGNFNVAKTYSITVNGTLAQTFYRTVGADAVGTWKLTTTTGGSGVITPGLNKVVVRFWDAINGTGNVLKELTADVYFNGGGPGTTVSGTLTAPGSVTLVAPTTYVPGVPFLVRVDQRDSAGNVNRNAWNGTATLTATNGVIVTPNTITLTNGVGSALVTLGSSSGGGTVNYFTYGTGGGGGAVGAQVGTGGSTWRYRTNLTDVSILTIPTTWKDPSFVDTAWPTGQSQIGYGDTTPADENLLVATTDYNGATTGAPVGPAYLFRSTFTIADIANLTSVTGQVKYDDAAIVYVNGTEVLRTAGFDSKVNVDQVPLTTYAAFGGAPTTENATAALTIPMNLLTTGVNTIAVQVHQHDSGSSDMTFDLRLQGNLIATTTDPGNFTLTASVGALTAQKAIISAGTTPTMTNVSGNLPAGTTIWSGIMNVTGDVTVPTGATLQIQPGTMVLVAGSAYVQGTAAVDTTGADLIVNGNLQVLGTAANPISICCSNAANRWGEMNFGSTATASNIQYCLMSRSGHSPSRGGHIPNSGGAMFMLNGTTLTIDDSVMADGVGKTMANSGNANVTIRRSHIGRFTMGPELGDSAITIEDSNFTDMLQIYRERGAQDDEDCLYIHSSGGRPVNLRRSVFARCDDDALDLLAGSLTVEDCIIRNAFDKGVSMLQNNITMLRCQIIDNDVGVSAKCQTGADESVPYLTILEGCTIRCENHPTNTGDQSPLPAPQFHSVGIHTRNKYGTTTMNITQRIKDCIISAEEPLRNDYPTVGSTAYPLMEVTYSCYQDLAGAVQPTVAGTGNITADPLFVDATNKDFRLQVTSPCRDSGDIALTDADLTRRDMGALIYGASTGSGTGEIIWNMAGSPYRVTADTVVPVGLSLRIDPGVNVLFDQNRKLTVNGTIRVLGTANQGVVFSNVPGTTATDPISGQANQPQKWAGLVVQGPTTGPAITGSEFRHCTFLNAQPAAAAGNTGSLGVIRAFALVDHCIFLGTRLRQLYGENCALQVQYSTFVDPFNPSLDTDNPIALGLDNIAEPLKVANANIANPNYVFGLPIGGYFRVWYNEFHGNKGHNDVFDADSGGFDTAVGVGVNSTNPILDCRYNNFLGFTGDEHIDLGGDAYVASNVFQRGHKDVWTNDHGYSNCISSGDKSGSTTIWVVRNVAFDVDHMINCKSQTATIFEHNTVANFYPDFSYTATPPLTFTQNVKNSAINQYVPDDDSPSRGAGAYISNNIFHNIPRVVTWADLPTAAPTIPTKLEAQHNYLNGLADNSVGPVTPEFAGGTMHPGGFTALGPFVSPGDPQFVDEAGKNYQLKPTSPARGTAPGGIDYGATVAEWAHVTGGPVGATDQTTASFTIGGPAMVAYKWRLDGGVGGAWSPIQQIGNGLIFPRGAPATVRQASLTLTGLTAGTHTLEVLGRDPAGNWQDADPARTAAGLPQAAPTVRTWTVDTAGPIVQITEVAANPNDGIDWIELKNLGSTSVDLGGWFLTDQASLPNKYPIPAGTIISAGGYLKIDSAASGLHLDKDGDDVSLYLGTTLKDTTAFGPQPLGYTLGRFGNVGAWTLCSPSPLASNTTVPTGSNTNIRINEWLASNDIHYKSDWIELINLDTLPVSLTGLVLTDNRPGLPAQFVIPPYSYIAANGFQTYIADSNPSAGPNHLNFGLDVQQETISLLNGTQLQDEVQFYPQIDDYSQNRDANGLPIYNVLPTIGFTNGTSDPGYANALAILNGLRISEIMFNGQGGNDFDWIELRNIGAVSLNLGGVAFIQGISFTFPTMSLAPGAEIVLVANSTAFTGRYGGAVTIAGTYTGKLDNGGETLALALPAPWDACVLVFAYNDKWYPNTDGLGKSLDLITNQTVLHNFGDRDSWQESAAIGGTPTGQTISVPSAYVPWLAYFATADGADADNDGLSSLVEFGLGMNPLSGSAGNGASGAPTPSVSIDNRITLNFALPVNAALTNGHGQNEVTYQVQISDDLQSTQWTTIATKTPTTSWTGAATVTTGAAVGGFMPITVKDTTTLTDKPRHFLRLNMTWTPPTP